MRKLKFTHLKALAVFCLLPFFSYGQMEQNVSHIVSTENVKNSGMIINHSENGNVREETNSSKQKQLSQIELFQTSTKTHINDDAFASRNPEDEIIEKRDRTSKHFRNSDGTIEAHLSSGSIHYFEDEHWQTIERTILPNISGKFPEYEYANTKNSFKTYLSTNQSKGIKTLIDGKEIIEWRNKKIEFLDENLNPLFVIDAENGKLKVDDSKAIYSNIFPNTDANITQLHEGRKIDYEIISSEFLSLIPENAKYIAVSEDIVLPKGWKAKYYIDKMQENPEADNQQISVFNQNGEEILRYMPPAYFEKANQYDIENPVGHYQIEQNGQILSIKIITKADWFFDENRQFPVVIDPTVNVFAQTAGFSTGRAYSDNSGGDNQIRIGRWTSSPYAYVMGWSRFDLSSISSTNTVTVADFKMYQNGGSANRPGATAEYMLTNCMDPYAASFYSDIYNSVNTAYSSLIAGLNDGHKTAAFNATGINAIQNGLTSGFVAIGLSPQGTFWDSYARYANMIGYTGNTTITGTSYRPYLSITYTEPGTPPTCTTPIMPTDGFSGHSPADPLTWNSATDATSYDIYFGTSSNPSFVINVATTSYSPALADNTTYYWKIVPKNAYGEPTGCSVWEFTTGAGPQNGDYRSRYMDATNRTWSTASNWQIYNGSSWITASSAPSGSSVNVLIRDNSKMILDGDYEIDELRIEGLLQFYWGDGGSNNDAQTLIVNGDVLLIGDADLQTNYAYDANRNFAHLLILKGSLYNNANAGHGILFSDYPEIDYWSFVQVRFKGSGDAEWSGSGENDIGGLSILKDNASDVVTIKPTELLGWGTTNLDKNGFFMYDVIDHIGTLKIGGTFSMTTRFGIQSTNDAADAVRQLPMISSAASGNDFTLIIDNPNFGIAGYLPIECYGNLQITQGTINVGDSMDDYIEFTDGSSLIVDGGDLTCTGSIAYLGTGSFAFNLSDGRIRAGYYGNSNSNIVGWLDIRNNATVNISGGEIHLINMNFTTSLDYPMYNMAASNITITGGVLQIGSSVSPVGTNTFSIAGPTPSIELYGNGTTIESNAILWDNVQCYGDLDIPEFCGLSIYDQDHSDLPYTFSITGNINHIGNIYAEVEDSKILFNGTSAQIFHTTGAYNDTEGTAGISIVEVDNSAGVLLTGSSTAVTKNLISTDGTFNLGDCSLGLYGIVTRTNGYLGGNENSELYIYGSDDLGNLFFDPTVDTLKSLNLDRTMGIISLATDLNVSESINFTNGVLYTYLDRNVANSSQTIYLAPDAELLNENNASHIYGAVSISNDITMQTVINSPEPFDSDFLVHGFSAATTVWFAPDSNTEIDHLPTGGCPDGRIGYSGNWNNYWGNFVRLPETSCTGYDNVVMSFDVSHSYFAAHPDDWLRFYMWADGGYENNIVSVKIDGVDVTHDAGINGKGFKFTEIRSCASVEVLFDISAIVDKSDILFYLEAHCEYNNSNVYYVYFDNIGISGVSTTPTDFNFGNVWAIMENVNTNLGDVTVTRVTGEDGEQTISDYTNIDCYWDIDVGTQPTIPIDMTFKWLDIFDNGLSTSEMSVFTLHNPDPWEELGTPVEVTGNPRIISADANQFSRWTISVKDQILPIDMLNFDVTCDGNIKILKWTTASEINNDFFIIQKSNDAKTFINIGQVDGSGSSKQINNYNFYDEQFSAKEIYYRIKQVDYDGTYEYSKIITAKCDDSFNPKITAYPNPFDGQTLYLNSSATFENVLIEIYDAAGRLVYKTVKDEIGNQTVIKIDKSLEPGAYVLKIICKQENSKQIPIIVK